MEKTLILQAQEKINLSTIEKDREIKTPRRTVSLTYQLLVFLLFLLIGISLLFLNQIIWGACILFINVVVYLIIEKLESAFTIDIRFDKKDQLEKAIMEDLFLKSSRDDV